MICNKSSNNWVQILHLKFTLYANSICTVTHRPFQPDSAIVVRASCTGRKITKVTVTTKPLISGKCKTNVRLFTKLSLWYCIPAWLGNCFSRLSYQLISTVSSNWFKSQFRSFNPPFSNRDTNLQTWYSLYRIAIHVSPQKDIKSLSNRSNTNYIQKPRMHFCNLLLQTLLQVH